MPVPALVAIIVAGRMAPAQPRVLDDARCRAECGGVTVSNIVKLQFPDQVPLLGLPRLIRGDRQGRVVVIQTRQGLTEGPPVMFEASGEFAGTLGRYGRGPGETEHPDWLDADFDDSIRVVESQRLVVYDAQLRSIRTGTLRRWISRPQQVVAVGTDRFAAIGSGAMTPGSPRPIEYLGTLGARPMTADLSGVAAGGGGLQVLARSRHLPRGELWMGRYSLSDGAGYDLALISPDGRVLGEWRRRPKWWVSIRLSEATAPAIGIPIVSRLMDVRDIGDGRLLVLIAQPSSDPAKRRAAIAPRTGAGWWNRYDTIVELVDVGRGEVVGNTRVPGFPRFLVGDRRFATYTEVDDEPQVEVVTVVIPR